jgi:hypothetical protein
MSPNRWNRDALWSRICGRESCVLYSPHSVRPNRAFPLGMAPRPDAWRAQSGLNEVGPHCAGDGRF